MLGLGFPKRGRGLDLRYDLAGPNTGGVHIGNRVERGLTLLVARVVNRRPVAQSTIVPLLIARRRIVNLEEEFEQVAIARQRRVEHDLNCLSMRAVVAVGRIGNVAPGVANPRAQDARLLANEILDPPKATAGEDGSFTCRVHVFSDDLAMRSSSGENHAKGQRVPRGKSRRSEQLGFLCFHKCGGHARCECRGSDRSDHVHVSSRDVVSLVSRRAMASHRTSREVQLRSALNLNVQASFAIAALAIALPLPAFAYTGEKLERSVNVSAARAKAAALKKEPGTIVGMELEKEKGGTGIRYTFTISIRGIKHEVGIDANTGVVLEDILEGKNPD